jgi:uncharacterized protein YjbI with pentapeptide repeats
MIDFLMGIAESLRDLINTIGEDAQYPVYFEFETLAYAIAILGVVIAIPLSALEISLIIYRRHERQARRVGRQMARGLVVLFGIALLAILLACVFIVPNYVFTRELPITATTEQLKPVELLQAKNNIRTATVQAFGGLVLLIGAFFTSRQIRLTREGQLTERFGKAIDQLGSDKLNVRLGAIHALARISKASRAERSAVVEILTEHIRTYSPRSPSRNGTRNILLSVGPASTSRLNGQEGPPTDVQLVMALLARRRIAIAANQAVTLSGVSLGGVDLPKAYLQKVTFRGSDLRGINLLKADLWRSDFEEASLQGAILERANLQRTSLKRTNIEGARLVSAFLKKADLRQSRLVEANLQSILLQGSDLQGTDLRRAHLNGASLSATRLVGTIFDGADLRKADFTGANAWFGGPRADSLLKNVSSLWASIWARSQWADSHWASSEWANLGRLKRFLIESPTLRLVLGGFISTWAARYLGGSGDSETPLVSFRGCDLRRAGFYGSYFPKADLQYAKLDHARISGGNFREARLTGATLRRTKLMGVSLRGAQLQGADMQGATLSRLESGYLPGRGRDVDLRGANLQGTNLRNADLRGAQLRTADLRNADLRNADLRGTDLRNADLRGARLQSADLRGTALLEADLRAADLRETQWRSRIFRRHSVLLEAAIADSMTQWPADLDVDEHGVITAMPSS